MVKIEYKHTNHDYNLFKNCRTNFYPARNKNVLTITSKNVNDTGVRYYVTKCSFSNPESVSYNREKINGTRIYQLSVLRLWINNTIIARILLNIYLDDDLIKFIK